MNYLTNYRFKHRIFKKFKKILKGNPNNLLKCNKIMTNF